MLLRKLIVFAITSGLAKRAYDHYRATKSQKLAQRPLQPRTPTASTASTPPNY